MKAEFIPLAIAAVVVLASCSEPPVSPAAKIGSAEARGGPAPAPPGSVTLPASGFSLVADGHGDYVNNVCGVTVGGPSSTGVQLWTKGASIPASQNCTGIAPRGGTVTLAVRHVSDVPHVDESPTPIDGNLSNFKMGFGANGVVDVAVINAGSYCFYRAKNGSLSGKGLRFDPTGYPKTNNLKYTVNGTNSWHVFSDAWPSNLAYCEGDSGISYWHVTVDYTTNVLP